MTHATNPSQAESCAVLLTYEQQVANYRQNQLRIQQAVKDAEARRKAKKSALAQAPKNYDYGIPIGPMPLVTWNPNEPTKLTDGTIVKLIIRGACQQNNLTRAELLAHRRFAELVLIRHIVIWEIKTLTSWSLPQIGRYLGGFDHTSVLHAVRRIQKMMDEGKLKPSTLFLELKAAKEARFAVEDIKMEAAE